MVRRRTLLLPLLLLLALLTHAQTGPIKARVLVKLKEATTPAQFIVEFATQSRAGGGVWLEKSLSIRSNVHLMMYDSTSITSDELLEELRLQPDVEEVAFDYYVESRTDPDDPNLQEQWGLATIQAEKAWAITTGGVTARGDTIVVAVLDSGFDVDHEDLAPNIWVNRGEIPNDGKDNDRNGYIDDTQGWNFIQNRRTHLVEQHGQSVAGIIGAVGNNGIGVSGINWHIKVMVLEARLVSEIISAYEYIIEQRDRYNRSKGKEGAFVVATNASFGINRLFCKDQPLWGAMYDRLGEVGVLTAAGAANNPWDVDEVGDMPTTCPSEYLLTVLNTTEIDQRYVGSAYGKTSIDMGAPGQNSFTTKPFGTYGSFHGNSAAAPHLAGSIALLYSVPCRDFAQKTLIEPSETALRVKEALLKGVDEIESLKEYTTTGGRLNVYRSLEHLRQDCRTVPDDFKGMLIYPNPARSSITLTIDQPEKSPLSVRALNMLGQPIYAKQVEVMFPGIQQEVIPVSNWPPGTYFIEVSMGKERKIGRVVVN
ncbi:S8/S53 family peptidase [Haliscomenobacter hydrossis]|uniref:Peptidase S8 and S53 subtilisin kexin sedolisin n=1 Tax=Haliscomenobacter hydrossis (strain ATCC 27775 / DSM 1100 / LMG 10767 / O) TaxID=760192 RepID=F4KYX1_HALH1|nr:S8/S53 family peptidase [Haliscomenobacter hydrossis]AEE52658.1 peptidase S8 and S53 subtilisin kexin sedolisin [Haliscomenobacter hydrossis DSM 1100]